MKFSNEEKKLAEFLFTHRDCMKLVRNETVEDDKLKVFKNIIKDGYRFPILGLPIGPKPRAIETIPMTFPRSPSSLKRSAIIPKPSIKIEFVKSYQELQNWYLHVTRIFFLSKLNKALIPFCA